MVQYPLQHYRMDMGHLYCDQQEDNRAGHLYQVEDQWLWFQEEGTNTMLHKQEGDY